MADDKPVKAPDPAKTKATEPDDVVAARKQLAEDREWQAEHPNEPLIRGANKNVGGE